MSNEEMISLLGKARDWAQALSDTNTVLKNAANNIRCCIKELQERQKERTWHSVDEAPLPDEQLLCKTKESGYIVLSEDDAWQHNTAIFHITEWCYLANIINEHQARALPFLRQ